MIRTAVLAFLLTGSLTAFAADATQPAPDLAKAKQTAETVCAACHGPDGNSPTAAYPILAGQGADYLNKQLADFKPGDGKPAARPNDIMAGMASMLSPEDMQAIALFFSKQKVKPSAATEPKLVEIGKQLWRKGDFERGIPACAGCHGPAGAGLPAQYPRLAGQYAEYTVQQLKNFRAEERSNDPERMMRTIADKMSDRQIKAVADYIAGLR